MREQAFSFARATLAGDDALGESCWKEVKCAERNARCGLGALEATGCFERCGEIEPSRFSRLTPKGQLRLVNAAGCERLLSSQAKGYYGSRPVNLGLRRVSKGSQRHHGN